MLKYYDVIVIGAGAAGMMSAIEAGKRGRKVLLVDHYKKIGEKIRISGGGRCNFTNIHTNPNKFLSQNPKFVRSALSQYTQNDFINLINKYEIKFHEKKLGQLFLACSLSKSGKVGISSNFPATPLLQFWHAKTKFQTPLKFIFVNIRPNTCGKK